MPKYYIESGDFSEIISAKNRYLALIKFLKIVKQKSNFGQNGKDASFIAINEQGFIGQLKNIKIDSDERKNEIYRRLRRKGTIKILNLEFLQLGNFPSSQVQIVETEKVVKELSKFPEK